LADTTQIVDGLMRLAGSQEGLPLLAAKNAAGAFPAGKPGKEAAAFCGEHGLVRSLRHDSAGRAGIEIFTISEAGVAWLRKHASAASALDSLAAAVGNRLAQLDEAARQSERQQEQLLQLATLIETLAQKARQDAAQVEVCLGVEATILSELKDWPRRHPLKDCALPDLFRMLQSHRPAGTIGEFHDACRRLCEQRKVYLHPWTGPLYEMPEPALAFLFGHEIAYYASLRSADAAPPNGTYIADDAALEASTH